MSGLSSSCVREDIIALLGTSMLSQRMPIGGSLQPIQPPTDVASVLALVVFTLKIMVGGDLVMHCAA